MPKTVDKAKRKDEIGESAVQAFSEHGFSETNVQQIADEADISKGSIYLYFESKNEILSHVFQNFEEALHDALDRVIESDNDPDQKLKDLMYDLTTLVRMNRPTIKVLFDFWSHSLHSTDENQIDFESFYGRLREKLSTLLRDGASQGFFRSDLKEITPSVLIGMFEGQLIQWLVDPTSPSLEDVKETGYDLFMEGIGREEE